MHKRKRTQSPKDLAPRKKAKEFSLVEQEIIEKQLEFQAHPASVFLDTSTDPETGEKRHDYYVDGKRAGKDQGYSGVTTYIHSCLFEEFDKEESFTKVKRSIRYMGDPTYRYFMKTKEEIFKMWDNASLEGSALHDSIDEFFKTGNTTISFNGKHESLLRCCLAGIISKLVPDCYIFASEVALVDTELRITGCIDALFYNPKTKKFILLDWKANSVKVDHFGKMGRHPTSAKMPDTKYQGYHCQLNMYSLMFQRVYNIWCEACYVIGFGMDKLLEKPLKPNGTEEDHLVQLLTNVDVFTVPIDLQFQADFISNRLREVREFDEKNSYSSSSSSSSSEELKQQASQ